MSHATQQFRRAATFVVAATVVILAACADDQHSTAPASSRSASNHSAANADVGPSTQGIRVPYAKPTDQVGFTTIVRIQSAPTVVTGGVSGGATADCPAGTVLTGGGFWFPASPNSPPPFLRGSFDNGHNSWAVLVDAGLSDVTIYAFANCAS